MEEFLATRHALVRGSALGSTARLAQGETNTYLEAHLIHARVLCDFFERASRTSRKDSELDDVLAADFDFEPTALALPTAFRERLNKDLAHLSYSRGSRLDEAKSWALDTFATPILARCTQFAVHVVSGGASALAPEDQERWEQLLGWLAAETHEA